MTDKPILIGYDPASGIDQSVIARLRGAGGGTVFEIIEMQRHAEPLLEQISAKLAERFTKPIIDAYYDATLTGQGWVQMYLDKTFKVKQVPTWRYHRWPQLPQWRPLMRRPQQRSAKMRKHRRIVLSRMTPNEARLRRATWERLKASSKELVNPNMSDFWRGVMW